LREQHQAGRKVTDLIEQVAAIEKQLGIYDLSRFTARC
jgi:hypothetical protein